MIQLAPSAEDAPEFIEIVAKLIAGLDENGAPSDLHLIHIDNWFGPKWLRFSAKTLGASGQWRHDERLTPPGFSPSRVVSHRYFRREAAHGELIECEAPVKLHIKTSAASMHQRRLSALAPGATIVWYSGKSQSNRKAALMAYVATDFENDGGGWDTWYVSLEANPQWTAVQHKAIKPDVFRALVDRQLS